jgi:hypothetical protein
MGVRCCITGCLRGATHGVYFTPSRQRWSLDKRGARPHKAPLIYCRWHATVQAVCRNAGAVPHERDHDEE